MLYLNEPTPSLSSLSFLFPFPPTPFPSDSSTKVTERDLVKGSIERDLPIALWAASFLCLKIKYKQEHCIRRLGAPASWLSSVSSRNDIGATMLQPSLSAIDAVNILWKQYKKSIGKNGILARREAIPPSPRSFHKGHILRPSRFHRFSAPSWLAVTSLTTCQPSRRRSYAQSRRDQRRSFAAQDLGSFRACNQR